MFLDLANESIPPSLLAEPIDLAIIGSGPVGLAIAKEFAGSNTRVVIVESGGWNPDPTASDEDQGESIGAPRASGAEVRQVRAFGGTSHVWSGRCAPLDAIDFEQRDWVPFSGWPVGPAELDPYVERAHAMLGLIPHDYDKDFDARGREESALSALGLRPQSWQYSQDQNDPADFARPGSAYVAHPAPNIDVLLHATATRVVLDPANGLESLEITSAQGQRHILKCRRAILCAGAIENARLLMVSWRHAAAPPSAAANTGRFLMDHPRATIGVFDGREVERLSSLFGLRIRGRGHGRHFFTTGCALAPEQQRRLDLLNCAAWITEIRSSDDPWNALRRIRIGARAGRDDLIAALLNAPTIARGALRAIGGQRGVVHKCDALNLDCLVEQLPDPDSRLTLTERTDAVGMPTVKINWKIGERERASLLQLSDNIMQLLDSRGLPRPQLSEGFADRDLSRIRLRDVAHPSGTTRMAREASTGVVDENCAVHGVPGLYVAGSSVFPTAGHANPTLMAVALAIRLATHLKSQSTP